jgi:sarcosine oxidase
MQHYQAIVIGAGAMGSAALFHLAGRGQRVLGLERFDIPHHFGSSHGITRIIRLAYYEHASYVPLLRRAYELWRELEAQSQTRLLHITGSIDASPAGDKVFEGSLRSCELHNLPHEVLTSSELSLRFPAYRLPPETMAVLQPDGGFLVPESCISAHVMLAQARGAEVRGRERVIGWESGANGVTVTTDQGVYQADRLILAAGAWMPKLVPSLASLLVPERQVLAWLSPFRPEWFAPSHFPVFNLDIEEGHYYGFPVFGIPGFKFGRYHHRAQAVDPDNFQRDAEPEDETLLRHFAERYFPDGAGPTLSMHTCMFTNSPDEHFIVDSLPGHPEVIIASPCSGHGFKFSSVIGEILADLVIAGETRHDTTMFGLERFSLN